MAGVDRVHVVRRCALGLVALGCLLGLARVAAAERWVFERLEQAGGAAGQQAGAIEWVRVEQDDQWQYLKVDLRFRAAPLGGFADGFWLQLGRAGGSVSGNGRAAVLVYADFERNRVALYRGSADPLNFDAGRSADFLARVDGQILVRELQPEVHAVRVFIPLDRLPPLAVEYLASPLSLEGSAELAMNLTLDSSLRYDGRGHLLGYRYTQSSTLHVPELVVTRLPSLEDAPDVRGQVAQEAWWIPVFLFGMGGLIWLQQQPRYMQKIEADRGELPPEVDALSVEPRASALRAQPPRAEVEESTSAV